MAARKSVKRKQRSSPAAGSVAARLPKPRDEAVAAARQKFFEGAVDRGEAVPEGKPLPSGATHEIVDKDGKPVLKRKRFSL